MNGTATPSASVAVWSWLAGTLLKTTATASPSGAFAATLLPEAGTTLVAATPADFAVAFPDDARVTLRVYGLRVAQSSVDVAVAGGDAVSQAVTVRNPGKAH